MGDRPQQLGGEVGPAPTLYDQGFQSTLTPRAGWVPACLHRPGVTVDHWPRGHLGPALRAWCPPWVQATGPAYSSLPEPASVHQEQDSPLISQWRPHLPRSSTEDRAEEAQERLHVWAHGWDYRCAFHTQRLKRPSRRTDGPRPA